MIKSFKKPLTNAIIEKRFSIAVNCVKCNNKFSVNIDSFKDFKNYRLSFMNSDLCFYDCPYCDFVFIGKTNIKVFDDELEIEEDYFDEDDEEDYFDEDDDA